MNTSNFARLKELFRRAAAGQELTIGFLGGSITQGSLSTQPGNAYAFRVYQWFVDTFPQSKFHYVNGGIGGTSSHYGVARAVTDVLMYQPDFVAVDFSVNDLEVPFRQETYEGVVRKLLTWPSHPAVVLLNNIYYDTGETSQDEHNAVGDHYGVPHVSIRDSIYKDLRAGKYASRTLLSPMGCTPTITVTVWWQGRSSSCWSSQRPPGRTRAGACLPGTAHRQRLRERPAADHPGALPQAGGFPGRPGGKAGASGPLEKRLDRSEARG